MDGTVLVDVEWDGEAQVWIASSPAIGLFTESETLDGIRRKVPPIASDLLDSEAGQGVHLHVELRVRFDEILPAAAA